MVLKSRRLFLAPLAELGAFMIVSRHSLAPDLHRAPAGRLARVRSFLSPEEAASVKNRDMRKDVTSSLQRALDAVAQKGVIELHAGVYHVTSPLKPQPGTTIRGVGDVVIRHNTTSSAFDVGGLDHVTFENIAFTTGTTERWSNEAQFRHACVTDGATTSHYISFVRCQFVDTNYMGILFYNGGVGHVVRLCRFIRTGRDGVDIRGGRSHQVVDNYAEDTGDDAFVVTSRRYKVGSSAQIEMARDVVISGNIALRPGSINLGGSGIRVGAIGAKVSHNKIIEPSRYGIVVSCLDETASSRPSDVWCSNNYIKAIGDKYKDAAAYALRDVDYITISGGCIDCQGDVGHPTGIAFYIKNNTRDVSSEPALKSLTVNSVLIIGANIIVCQAVFNSKEITFNGGVWRRCFHPTRWMQKHKYSTGCFILNRVIAEDPLSYAFFDRRPGEPNVDYLQATGLIIRGGAVAHLKPPFRFGGAKEVGVIGRALISDCDFSRAAKYDGSSVRALLQR